MNPIGYVGIGYRFDRSTARVGLIRPHARPPSDLLVELDAEVGVLAIGAQERRDGAVGESFDGVDEADLHAVLPREPGLADVVPLAGLEERSLAAV
jgi:hypothetical protein